MYSWQIERRYFHEYNTLRQPAPNLRASCIAGRQYEWVEQQKHAQEDAPSIGDTNRRSGLAGRNFSGAGRRWR